MASVDGGIANLVQGVSQQPRRDRRDGQCTLQENMSSDLVRNLTRRPGSKLLASMFTDAADYNWLELDLGSGHGLYFVATKSGAIRVFSSLGVEQTVNATSTAYITNSILSHTIIDGVTYMSNPDTVTAMTSDVFAYAPGALIQVLGGQYGRTYEIAIGDPDVPGTDITFSYTTPDGSVASHITNIATDYIATQLETAANAITNFTDNYSIQRAGDVLHIIWNPASTGAGTRIEITTKDGEGGVQLVAISDRADSTGHLPRFAPDNYVVKVTGLDTAEENDVYFKFTQEKAGFGNEGLWVEAVAWEIQYAWDTATMPHTLVRETSGDFTFGPGNWTDRRVGDDNTNAIPSFHGVEVVDLSSFQGRLVFLTDTHAVLSRTNKALDMWKQSATTGSASDRIDLGSTAKNARNMRYMVPHNRDLVIFADKAQFIIFGRTSLTPDNAALVLTTDFQVDLDARPAPSGRNIFFASNYGNFTGVREFFTEGDVDINDSRPVTAHCNKYLEGSATRLTSSSNFDLLLVQTQASTELYVYQFMWTAEGKVQSSWCKWIFDEPIVFTTFDKSTIYVILQDGDEHILETIEIDVQADNGLDYSTHVDHKQIITSATDTYTMPHVDADIIAVQGMNCPNPGMTAEITAIGSSTVTLADTYGATAEVIFGVPFLSRYKPTMPMMKDRKGIKVGTGTLVINNFLVSYQDTGSFYTKVTSQYSDDAVDYFSGRIAGDPNNIVGEQPIVSGTFYVDISDDADIAEFELYTSSHTPMTINDIEWQGQWNKKGRRTS